jgi:hypothetical protein
MKTCEHCGVDKPRPEASEFDLMDYCAECFADLCDECMAKGCCDVTPARSGNRADQESLEAEGEEAEQP